MESKIYPRRGPGRYCPKCGYFTRKVVMNNPKFSFFFIAFQDGETYHCPMCDIVFRVTIANADKMRHAVSYLYKDGKEVKLPEENCVDGPLKD